MAMLHFLNLAQQLLTHPTASCVCVKSVLLPPAGWPTIAADRSLHLHSASVRSLLLLRHLGVFFNS